MSKIDKARAATAKLRKQMKSARGGAIRRVSNGASAYLIGKGVSSGRIEAVPSIMGAPRTVTIGLVGGAIAMFAPGTIADVGEGVLDSSIAIAGYEYGKGGEISGAGESYNSDELPAYDEDDEPMLTEGEEEWQAALEDADEEDEWESAGEEELDWDEALEMADAA